MRLMGITIRSLFPNFSMVKFAGYLVVLCYFFLGFLGGLALVFHPEQAQEEDDETEIENWSSTHSVKTMAYLQPESAEEVRCARRQTMFATSRWPVESPQGREHLRRTSCFVIGTKPRGGCGGCSVQCLGGV